MANTFKFGNGQWAVGKETALAYNDENGNFKPLPFSFDRASSATVVNKDGLIETVGADEPRIDFLNNTNGHLLLEPSRTNYSIYSENTSTWTYVEFGSGSAGTITTGKTDMFGGTNAVQIDFPANVENVSVRFGHTTSSISSGTAQTSLYIKLVGSTTPDKIIQLRTGSDAENTTISGDTFVRYTKTHTKASNEAFNVKLRPSEGTSSGGFSIIICHPQEEAGSYATSYIPTSGSTATRSAEICNGAGNSTVFNDSEGVLYFEVKALNSNVGTNRKIVLGDGSYNNGIEFGYQTTNNKMQFIIRSSTGGVGVTMNIETTAFDVTEFNKIAISYKSNEGKVFVNGSQVGTTDTSVTTPTGIDQLDLKFSTGFDFNSIVKDLKVYNTALSDSELQQLTS